MNSALKCLFSLPDRKLVLWVSAKRGRKACRFRGAKCKTRHVLVRFSELWSPCSFWYYFCLSSFPRVPKIKDSQVTGLTGQ